MSRRPITSRVLWRYRGRRTPEWRPDARAYVDVRQSADVDGTQEALIHEGRPSGADAGIDEWALLQAHAAVIERPAPDRLVVTAANARVSCSPMTSRDGELRSVHRLVSVPETL